MKKIILRSLALLAIAVNFSSVANAAGPTKDVMQPAQGLVVAQERCTKYAGDEEKEVACVLFHAGAITKDAGGKYAVNVQLLKEVVADPKREPGQVRKCKAEFVQLPDGSIGWVNDHNCTPR